MATRFSSLKSDIARIDFLKMQLTKDDRLIMRTLLTIFDRQTADEQRSKEVRIHNGIGFRAMDSRILSEYVTIAFNRDVYLKLQNKNVEFRLESVLSEKQAAFLKRRMPTYARQLLKVIKEKQKGTA